MKIVTASSGKKTIKLSHKEWKAIGKKAGWMKKAAVGGVYQPNETVLYNGTRGSAEATFLRYLDDNMAVINLNGKQLKCNLTSLSPSMTERQVDVDLSLG